MKIGKLSENGLKRSVLRQIKTKNKNVVCGAGVGVDCAIFSSKSADKWVSHVHDGIIRTADEAPDTDSLTIDLLIQKCANNLAAAGAEPVAVMLALLFPEETEEPYIRTVMEEAQARCKELGVEIAGGQTSVCTAVNRPVATVTGIGIPFAEGIMGKPGPEQDVVISKWIGLEGTARLAKKYKDGLAEKYPTYLVKEAAGFDGFLNMIPEAATAVKSGVCAMHDVSEGGIFGALWELAERAGVGLTIDLKKIPVRQETVEVCEFCEVNPYELLSGGCMLYFTEDGTKLTAELESRGIPAVIVGRTTAGKDRVIHNEEEVRYLDKPKQDSIYSCKM